MVCGSLRSRFAASSCVTRRNAGTKHLQLMAADPFTGDGRHEVRLAAPGEAEAQEVVAPPHEVGLQQRGQLAADFVRELLLVERLERFAGGQVRILELPLDFALEPVASLGFEQIRQQARVAPIFRFGSGDGGLILTSDGRKAHRAQEQW